MLGFSIDAKFHENRFRIEWVNNKKQTLILDIPPLLDDYLYL